MNRENRSLELVSALAIIVLLASACVSATPAVVPGAPAPQASTVAQTDQPAQPAAGQEKSIVYAVPALGLNMDPSFLTGGQTAEIQQNLYGFWTKYSVIEGPGGLMSDDASGGEKTMKGGLFESWEISQDALVYTMHLRKDIVDSFGNALKAADAKWMFDRMRGTNAGSIFIVDSLNVKSPDQVKVIDDYTLEFRLPAPNPIFLRVLNVNNGAPIGAATARQHATQDDPWATEWLKTNAPATGPYKLESWTPGVEQVLVANPYYAGPKPDITRVVYRQVPDSANRVALMLSGQADIVRDLSMDEFDRLKNAPGVKVQCFAGNQFVWAALHWTEGPTKDQKVRQALAYAVPYQQILDSVYKGLAKPLYGWLTASFADFLGADAFPYKTDYDQAKKLLAEAGFPNGFDTTIALSSSIPEHERIAVLLKDSFSQIGVNLSIDKKPHAAYRDAANYRKAPILLDQNYSFVLDPDYASFVWLHCEDAPSSNSSGFCDPTFDKMQTQGVGMPDGPERSQLMKDMQKRFYELTPWLQLANPPTCYAMSDKISGYVWHTHNQINLDDLKLNR